MRVCGVASSGRVGTPSSPWPERHTQLGPGGGGHSVTAFWMTSSRSAALNGQPAHGRVRLDVDEVAGTQQHRQLAEVHLGDDDVPVCGEDVAGVGRERVEVPQVGLGHREPLRAKGSRGGGDRSVGRAPPEHQHLGVAVGVLDLERVDGGGDPVDLRGAQPGHEVVVVGVVGDVAGDVGLLDAADAVLQPRGARDGPRAGQRLGVAEVRVEHVVAVGVDAVALRRELDAKLRQVLDRGDRPRLGAVGEVPVGEDEHRRHVRRRDAHRLDRDGEAVGGRPRRDDGHRRLAVAAEHRLQQVGLLGLGGQAGRRAAALDVTDDQGQLERRGQADRLGLERQAGTGGRRHADRPAERGARARRPRRRSRPRPGSSSRRTA